ncbi:MAG: ATP-binding protein [bacterium]
MLPKNANMYRKITEQLIQWVGQQERLPLIMRGARQTGKSYLIEQLGKKHFANCIVINFEQHPKYASCFASLDVTQIITAISLICRQEIIPGKTLLFFDEIQECPKAIMALRYFKEQMPALHVIAAGSLLEFALEQENLRIPVGRVQYIYLRPMSFEEFLLAGNHNKLFEYLQTISLATVVPAAIHEELLKLVKTYLLLGGMPAILASYFSEHNLQRCQHLQTSLLSTYRNDFSKYASKAENKYLEKVFDKTPRLIGQQVKYVEIDTLAKSRDLANALELLTKTQIISKIYATSASGLPLHAQVNEKKFKLQFLDVGLVLRACGLDTETFFQEDLMLINQGALCEQFVGQELLAYSDCYENTKLHYWTREKKGSLAEIDFVITFGTKIMPIEVKAGKTGWLRSLRSFIEEKNCPFGIRISKHPLSLESQIISIPFYLTGQLTRLLKTL